MLSSLRRVSFRGLICIALCLIGLAALAIGVTVLALRQDAIRDASNDAANIATVLAEQTSQSVQALDIVTTDIAERFANIGEGGSEEHRNSLSGLNAHRLLAERLTRIPHTDFIALVDRDGQLVNTSRNWPSPEVDVSDRDYFQHAIKGNDQHLFVSKIVRNRVSGQRNIIFARRISGTDGEFLGVVVTGIKLSYFQHIYNSITTLTNQSLLLLRSDGIVLVRHPDPDLRAGQKMPEHSDWYQLVRDGGGQYRAPGFFTGVPRLVAVRPLKDYPLVVNVAITEASALASWNYRAMLIGLGAALTLLCSLVLIYALNNKFKEIAASRASLAEREANLAEKTRELEQANLRVDRAVNNMGHGLCMFNAKQQLVVCNKTYIDLYNFAPDQVKPGTTFRQVLEWRLANGSFFGDVDQCVADLTAKIKAGENLVLVMDVGGGRTYCVTNRPTDDGGWVSTHEDITERVRAERELERARNMLSAVVENIPETLIVKDAKTRKYAFLNRAGEALLGISNEQFVGKTGDEIFPAKEAAAVQNRDEQALRTGHLTIESRAIETLDGRVRDVTSKRIAIGSKDGEPEYIINFIEDVTERRRNEKELQRARNMLSAVVENIPEMLVVKDAKSSRYIFINRAGEQLLGATKDELIGRTTADVFPRDQAELIVARDEEALRTGQLKVDFHVTRTLDGRLRDVASKRIAIGGNGKEPEYLLTVIEDITERKRNETRIAHLAHHDPLTDLANRAALHTKLTETVDRAVAEGGQFALLCIDLDRFKEVNDLYGHAAGDSVLLDISSRMQNAASGTFLARVGGDEFMAICVEASQPAAATALAERLVAAVSDDIDCEGRKVRIGMSIGIAMFPDDGTDSATLMRNADAALYRAKAEGRGAIRFFEAEMDRMLHDRRALQADLALALSRNELMLYYQPQAQVAGQIVGFEALIRWDHPRRGFVPPGTFIPLAEESGLIDQIGEWVLREACREAASWRKPLQIAINLSPVQLRQGDLAGLIHSVLIESGLSPDRLVIEITEGALMDDYSRSVSTLRRIKALGVRIAMDDFGTGYSSLSYLQSFPFDKIKIDQTFISNLDRNAQSAAIVRAVLGLGKSLMLTTVAEGVENQQQLAILRREGCDEMQGYLIGRPQPISDYADLVGRKEKRAAASA